MISSFFKIAFRHFGQHKLYAVLNVSGLAIGLLCMLLALLYWQDEYRFDRFHANASRLYRVTTTARSQADGPRVTSGGTGQVQGPAFQAAIPEVLAYTRLLGGDIRGDVRYEDRVLNLQMLYVDDNFFQTFSFPLLHGDAATALKEINSVVLSEETALRLFNTTDAVGKMLPLDADPSAERLPDKAVVVTGVAKSLPAQSSIQFDALFPIRFMQLSFEDKNWLNAYLGTFVLLPEKTDLGAIEQKMNAVYAQNAGDQLKTAEFDPQISYGLQPLPDIHLNGLIIRPEWNEGGTVNSSKPVYARLFLGIAFFIFLLASINFINISIAGSLGRAREVGIRKVNGGSRRSILWQFLGESALLCALAFTVALAALAVALPFFNGLADKKIALGEAFDWRLLAGFGGLFGINVLLSGLYPAAILSKFNPTEVLYGRTGDLGSQGLGKALVVVQFFLSAFLLVELVVYQAQMNFMLHKDLGYNPHDVVRVGVGGDRDYGSIKNFLKNEFSRYPAFQTVSFSSGFNGDELHDTKVGAVTVRSAYQHADANLLDVLGISLRAGRNFASETSREVIVNEAFVRAARLEQPLGAWVNIHPDYGGGELPYQIVGVTPDFHISSLHARIQPLAIYPKGWESGGIWLKIRRDRMAEALQTLEKLYRSAVPGATYGHDFLSDLNARAYVREQRWKTIIGIATGLSLLICCLGLFGLAHLDAGRRVKEIGIRKVLGASVAGITRLLAGDFLKLVVLAFVLAAPVAYFFGQKWLANYAYRIEIQAWMFALTAAIALGVALLTVSIQSIRAALADPVKSLRNE